MMIVMTQPLPYIGIAVQHRDSDGKARDLYRVPFCYVCFLARSILLCLSFVIDRALPQEAHKERRESREQMMKQLQAASHALVKECQKREK
jgi:hypothetical protein